MFPVNSLNCFTGYLVVCCCSTLRPQRRWPGPELPRSCCATRSTVLPSPPCTTTGSPPRTRPSPTCGSRPRDTLRPQRCTTKSPSSTSTMTSHPLQIYHCWSNLEIVGLTLSLTIVGPTLCHFRSNPVFHHCQSNHVLDHCWFNLVFFLCLSNLLLRYCWMLTTGCKDKALQPQTVEQLQNCFRTYPSLSSTSKQPTRVAYALLYQLAIPSFLYETAILFIMLKIFHFQLLQ